MDLASSEHFGFSYAVMLRNLFSAKFSPQALYSDPEIMTSCSASLALTSAMSRFFLLSVLLVVFPICMRLPFEITHAGSAEKISLPELTQLQLIIGLLLIGQKFLSLTYHWTDDDWNVQSRTLDLVPI